MRKKTDLKQVKTFAKAFLWLDIEETSMSPVVVKHPFTDSALTMFQNNNEKINMINLLEDGIALQNWRREMANRIDESESAFHIHLMVTKPYRIAFLKYIQPYLSKHDFSEILGDAWVRSENPNLDPNASQEDLISMFQNADPAVLMDEDEYEQYRDLDKTVTVYRGVTSFNAENIKAMSWTLDQTTAEWFAHRFGEDGTVYEAQINKEHILAYFNGRNEKEVIVDPQYLTELSEVQEIDDGFTQTM